MRLMTIAMTTTMTMTRMIMTKNDDKNDDKKDDDDDTDCADGEKPEARMKSKSGDRQVGQIAWSVIISDNQTIMRTMTMRRLIY